MALVHRPLDSVASPQLVMKDCQEGLRQVGFFYERQEYYLSGIIMAGEIFREVVELVQPVIERQVSGKAPERVLLGRVQGDIRNWGKNIASVLLGSHSFDVQDLGVDVPPTTFFDQTAQFLPHVVGLSGLVTSAYEAMRDTVVLLVICGSQLGEQVRQYVGADYWTTDEVAGVELCTRLVTAAG